MARRPAARAHSALAIAEAFNGEIISCDSTAVYRGLDIGTDKLDVEQRRGVPHHLIDVVDPTEVYSAARYGADAAAVARDITARGRLPIVVGGTGFYLRALVRGIFPGPAATIAPGAPQSRSRTAAASRRSIAGSLASIDASGRRIQPRDRKRLVRALEVYLLTGRPLTDHFDGHDSPAGVSRRSRLA